MTSTLDEQRMVVGSIVLTGKWELPRALESLGGRLHGNKSSYARYTDEELRQLIDWLPRDPDTECYVLFNNIPRVKDVQRFRELLVEIQLSEE